MLLAVVLRTIGVQVCSVQNIPNPVQRRREMAKAQTKVGPCSCRSQRRLWKLPQIRASQKKIPNPTAPMKEASSGQKWLRTPKAESQIPNVTGLILCNLGLIGAPKNCPPTRSGGSSAPSQPAAASPPDRYVADDFTSSLFPSIWNVRYISTGA